ncbi:hypothetical protein [Desulfoluna spongiiphila]|uniref:Uncharacterized protein n=1 Tax=Desulfoluna spongiiphila TaxID=419481 RepID=A0A1G5HS82_9BACT|nr:hypothetical protein [Desulfoluna spongiiphila]SCY66160.1 hypothetical protein SAMN05216233_11576 [Desulfoluna spongiiphila]
MKKTTMAAVLLMASLLLAPGCVNHVIHTHEGVSRDTTWIRVEEAKTPFVVSDIVGGEHITRYRILGFEGERYLITGSGENLYMSVDPGPSARLTSTPDDDTCLVEVLSMDALISIELSAHPVSEYTLEIHRVKAGDIFP